MDEQQAAIAMKRAKQQTVHRSNFPKETREKLLKEKIDHYTKKIFESLTSRSEDAEDYLRKVIENRAALFTLRVEDENGKVTDNSLEIEKQLKQYYADCARLHILVQAFQNSLSTNPAT